MGMVITSPPLELTLSNCRRNMFLAAAPYFQHRFASSDSLLKNFQSAELSVSTVGNLGSMILLTKLQSRANYPKRIIASLGLNIVIFTLLAISTKAFLGVSAGVYFAFLMVVVFGASLATGLCQNGVFAYVSSFGREEYTQGIMTGQGIAGVLPCIAQIVSVLSVPGTGNEKGTKDGSPPPPQESSTSAFAYFLTATGISALTLLAFGFLLSRHNTFKRTTHTPISTSDPDTDSTEPSSNSPPHKSIPLTTLFRKLIYLASAIFLTFTVTMIFPVYTSQILSTRPISSSPRLFHPTSFIPLAFLFWNIGDLLGRLAPAIPAFSLTSNARLLFFLSIARVLFIPLYMLCNIGGKGAKFGGDFFYLVIVQLLFGFSNGFLGSNCMMGFVEYVDVEEREAAGGFMSLCLVAGLTVGSFLSFFAAGSGK